MLNENVNTLEEAKIKWPVQKIGQAQDLTNQKFNRLTALYRTNDIKKRTQWVCQCDCGKFYCASASNLKNNRTQSCGCLYKENAHIQGTKSRKDLTGKIFGRLTVLNYSGSKNGKVFWHCQCTCGKEKDISAASLISGDTQSCGCLVIDRNKELKTGKPSPQKINLIGQKFSFLTVIEESPIRTNNGGLQWVCKCQCGNQTIVSSDNLRRGHTRSCGCIKSFGEQKISQILLENNIQFIREKMFKSCIFPDSQYPAKFDFYLLDYNILIEFDGEQHQKYDQNGWNTKDNFLQIKKRDQFKNEWCLKNNIPLIRIPYTYYNQIKLEDLLSNSKFLQKGY